MKLRKLEIEQLPGIDSPYALEEHELGDGVHVVVGPNASGKSSLCRATRALLWGRASERSLKVRAQWEIEGAPWSVERDGAHHAWAQAGVGSSPPPLPPEDLSQCFLLDVRDLMDSGPQNGREIAERIRREMAGGYDLEAARPANKKTWGKTESRQVADKERAIRAAEGQQDELLRRAQTLESLAAQTREGIEAQRREMHVGNAIALLDDREKLRDLETQLDLLPREALAKVDGGELKRLDDKTAELEKTRLKQIDRERDLRDEQTKIEQSHLEAPIEGAELNTWAQRAERWERLVTRRDEADRTLAGAKEALERASRSAGGREAAPPTLTLDDDEALFVSMRAAIEAHQARIAAEQRLELLSSDTFDEEARRAQQRHERAASALRAWLRAPTGEGGRESGIAGLSRKSGLILGLVVAVVGLALGFAIHPAFHALSGAGIALAVSAGLLSSGEGGLDERKRARDEFPPDVDPPAEWQVPGVKARLDELEQEIADGNAARRLGERESVQRQEFEARLEEAKSRESVAIEERREMASRLGLESPPEAAELADQVQALTRLRDAQVAVAQAEGTRDEIAAQGENLREEMTVWLVGLGEAPPADPVAAKAHVEGVKERSRSLESGRREAQRIHKELEYAAREIEKVTQDIRAIFSGLDLTEGDRAGLVRLLDQLPQYKDLDGSARGLRMSIASAEGRLGEAGETSLLDQDRSLLLAEQEKIEALKQKADDARDAIAEIQAKVEQASTSHSLEVLIAEKDEALATLEEKRDQCLEALAGDFLLDAVKDEHETHQLPDVLKRARELFALFTHQGYELQVAPAGDGSFLAVSSRTKLPQRLNELSGGECAQLLLAVRLAVAEGAEAGNPLPLFLDEALDQSDPVRFELIARSLGQIARDQDRQIFYLTNDGIDAQRIAEALAAEGCAAPQIIDLGEKRKRGVSVGAPSALRIEPTPTVPAPGERGPEEYGAMIEARRFDPRDAPTAQHLLYLLWDDLHALRRLLDSRIETVGQWLQLSRNESGLSIALKGEFEAGGQLDKRAELLGAFLEAWAEGRGKLVDRAVIEASEAVKERFMEPVVEIATELGNDGRRLIEKLTGEKDDTRLSRFQKKTTIKLALYLETNGYLDPRPVLSEPELRVRVLASPAARSLPEAVSSLLLDVWWQVSSRH